METLVKRDRKLGAQQSRSDSTKNRMKNGSQVSVKILIVSVSPSSDLQHESPKALGKFKDEPLIYRFEDRMFVLNYLMGSTSGS